MRETVSGGPPFFFSFKSPVMFILVILKKQIPNVHNTVCYMLRWYVQKKKRFKIDETLAESHLRQHTPTC